MLAQGLILASLGLSLRAFVNWRTVLYMGTCLAVIQDPIRKVTPGAPGYLVLVAAPVLLAAIAGLVMSKRGWWTEFARAVPKAADAYIAFAICCIPAALISATYASGSWAYTLLGVSSYGTMLMAIVLGFHLLSDERALRRVFAFYCVLTSVALVGGWLQWSGAFDHWQTLGSDALGMYWIRYRPGYIVELIGGFYRSPDVMGWHAAACAMLALLMALTTKGSARWFWLTIAAFAIATLLLCGRRKMVFMVPLFIVGVMGVFWISGRGRSLVAMMASAGFLLVVVLLAITSVGGGDTEALRYYIEGSSETLDSLQGHGFNTVLTTLRQEGVFGGGLGFATPGAHQIPFPSPRVWQESAPSRVMFELGIPGALGLAYLLFRLIQAAWRTAKAAARTRSQASRYAVGMLVFFVCNVGSLVVSGQILGDPFIAAFIGISLGLTLGFAKMIPLEERTGRRAARPAAPSSLQVVGSGARN